MSEVSVHQEKQEAFLQLYEPVHDRFARFCRAKLSNDEDAKDLLSETVLAAYENLHTLRKPEAFLFFLFGIATRLIKNKSRRKKFWGLFQEKESVKITDRSLGAEAAADIEILYKALNQLPEVQKEAVILFEISGFALKEIQEMQQASLSAVKARIVRGRRTLAKILQDPETDFYFEKDFTSASDDTRKAGPVSIPVYL